MNEPTDNLNRRQRGKALEQLMNFQGWIIVRQMMEDKVNSTFLDLVNTGPGDDNIVLTAHRLAHIAKQFVESLLEEIKNDIVYAQQEEATLPLGSSPSSLTL